MFRHEWGELPLFTLLLIAHVVILVFKARVYRFSSIHFRPLSSPATFFIDPFVTISLFWGSHNVYRNAESRRFEGC